MTALRGCPYCKGWMRYDQYACNECNGTNSRESYRKRIANLNCGLHAAAIEELRVRTTMQRIAAAREAASKHGAVVTALNLPKLRELLRAGTARPWQVDEVQATLVHASPWGTIQHCANVTYRPDAGLIAAAVNALPNLLAIAQAAIDVCEAHHPSRGPTLPVDLAKLRAAIDAARKAR